MRHVDDGTLHAWIDGEVTDAAAAARVEAHLRECRECAARLADARAIVDQADALLALAAPAAERPPVERIVERAGGAAASHPRTGRQWLLAASWAASLVLAAIVGWEARDRALQTGASRDASSVTDVFSPDRVARPEGTPKGTAEAAAPAAVQPDAGEPASGERAGSRAPALQPGARAEAVEQRDGSVAAGRASDAAPEPAASTPGAGRTVAVPSAPLAAPADQTASEAVVPGGPLPVFPPAAPLPAAPGTDATRFAETRPAAGASEPALPQGDSGSALGALSGARLGPFVDSTGFWQPVARTEAAARAQMPLYGIDGLTPTLTAIDPGGTTVRTIYRLEAGAAVELLQQKLSGAGAVRARPVPPFGAEVTAVDSGALPQPVWSGVRGDVRLTLRALSGTPDLPAASAKLRLD